MTPDISGVGPQATATAAQADASPSRTSQRIELQRVAQQFEAMLLTQMLREMRKAGEVDKGEEGEQGMGLGTESFTETIDAELGLHLAKNQGLGLTTQLMQAFDRLISGRSDVATAPPSQTLPVTGPETTSSLVAPHVSEGSIAAGEDGAVRLSTDAVTSAFGWRSDPFTGRATFHRGIDLRAAYGQDVPAAAPGTVIFSGEQRGYGTTVIVEHADGSRARYAHLSAATVEPGAEVTAGQSVGRAGRSGRATGTHLHFEVTSANGAPIAPGQWLARL